MSLDQKRFENFVVGFKQGHVCENLDCMCPEPSKLQTFLAGEESGKRILLEELSGKQIICYQQALNAALVGWKEDFGAVSLAEKVFEYSVPQLIAKIELQEKSLLNLKAQIERYS